MNNFIYNTPTKVFFGKKEEEKIGQILKSYNIKRILLHYGKGSVFKNGLYDTVVKSLKENDIYFVELGGVEPNPKLSLCLKGVELAKNNNLELILAIGGGSVLDSAKLIAHGAKCDFNPWAYSIKEKISTQALPIATILTLAATGSDMSSSCVITNEETLEKRGFNSELNRPLFAILNPELTYTVSKYQTACGTVDIMMHTLERYFANSKSVPITDNIALGLLKATLDSGKIVINDPTNYDARANLLWANSLSHNGLTSCGIDFVMSVHQLEHELSGMYDSVAHGAGLAVIWPGWAKIAYKKAIDRFKRFAYEVMEITPTDDVDKDILASIDKLQEFFVSLGMPTTLREFGVKEEDLEVLANNYTFKGKRVLNDIITVDYDMALKIYKSVF